MDGDDWRLVGHSAARETLPPTAERVNGQIFNGLIFSPIGKIQKQENAINNYVKPFFS